MIGKATNSKIRALNALAATEAFARSAQPVPQEELRLSRVERKLFQQATIGDYKWFNNLMPDLSRAPQRRGRHAAVRTYDGADPAYGI